MSASEVLALEFEDIARGLIADLGGGVGRAKVNAGKELRCDRIVSKIALGSWPCDLRICVCVEKWEWPKQEEPSNG